MAMQPVWTNQSGVSVAGTSTTSVLIIPDGISILMAFVLVTTGSSLRMSLQIAPTATGPWQTVGSTPALSDGMNGAASGQSYGAGFARLIVTNGVASSVSIWLTTEIVDGLGGSGGGGGLSTSVAVTSMPSLSPGSNAIGSVSVSSIPALPTGSNTIGAVNVASLPTLPVGSNTIGNVGIVSLPALPTGTNNIGTVQVSALPALPTGTNAIGTVSVSSIPALPTGTNAIGTVSVTALPALPTGSNNIGTVSVNPLPSGSNNIGTVSVASLPPLPSGSNTIGTVNLTTLPALPTGSNTIGNVNLNNGATVGISSIPALPTGTNTIGTVNVGTYPLNMQPPTIRSRETISLTSPLTNSVVNISGYTVVRNFNVISLTGSATLSINGTSNPVPLLQGDQLSDMNITSMYISTAGGSGWTVTIELQGN